MMDEVVPVFLMALGLCFDSFSVSTAKGVKTEKLNFLELIPLPLSFAAFQGGFFAGGWLAGSALIKFISSFDHWIAFSLLLMVGVKMIYEAIKDGEKKLKKFTWGVIIFLSMATSIDALAVGLASSAMMLSIFLSLSIVALTTFLISTLGIFAGYLFKRSFGDKAEIIGGIILIGLGIKIVVEHLFF